LAAEVPFSENPRVRWAREPKRRYAAGVATMGSGGIACRRAPTEDQLITSKKAMFGNIQHLWLLFSDS
jgi:hypothetical protein